MKDSIRNSDYRTSLFELKSTIKQSQIKAALSVNNELIKLYWDMGRQIAEKQQNSLWGSGFIDQLSKDLKKEFPDMKNFSKRNIELIKQWFLFYNKSIVITKQLVSKLQIIEIDNDKTNNELYEQKVCDDKERLFQIPWGHHILIVQKIKNANEAYFYINETISNNWSRSVLEYQIETVLYNRQGKSITNFKSTLPEIESDLANALLKDPYNFDFLMLTAKVKEQELEDKLVLHITQFYFNWEKVLHIWEGNSF